MKKMIAAVTAAVMVCSTSMTAMAYTFTDVTPTSSYSWALDYVEDLVSKKIIASDKLYNPAQTLNNQHILAFMGRILGINEEENAKAVDFAVKKYSSFLSQYDTYAQKEAAFLMYKGVFTQEEIKSMLDNKDTGVPRYQVAVYITKLLGGEDDVKNKVLVSLDYDDADKIPSSAQGYVEYVTEHDIMVGDNGNSFAPNTTINRAMMAVILSKVYKTMDRHYTTSQIASTTPSSNIVTTLDTAGLKVQNTLSADTKILIDGETKTVSDLKTGQTVTLTKSGNKIVEADVVSGNENVTTDSGIYAGRYESNGRTYIKVAKDASVASSYTPYPMASDATITYNDKAVSLSSIGAKDPITVQIMNGEVISLTATSQETQINTATVTAISYQNSTITIAHTNTAYNGKTYQVSPTAAVYRNNKTIDMADVAVGDTIDMVLSYQTVIKVTVYSTSSTVDGTIKAVTISSTPTIILTVDGEDKTYTIASDAKVTNDEENTDVYSLRVGYVISAKTEGQTITAINIRSASSTRTVEGTVQLVNPTYKYIKIVTTAGDTEEIFTTTMTKIMDTSLQTSYSLKELKAGDHVIVYGDYKSGWYEATSILVVKG